MYFQVQDQCNFEITSTTSMQDSPLGNAQYPSHRQGHKFPLNKRSTDRDNIQFFNKLFESVHMFDTIAGDICTQELFYEKEMNSQTCWNGTKIGR